MTVLGSYSRVAVPGYVGGRARGTGRTGGRLYAIGSRSRCVSWNIRSVCQYCMVTHWLLLGHNPSGENCNRRERRPIDQGNITMTSGGVCVPTTNDEQGEPFGRDSRESIRSPGRALPRLVSQPPQIRRHRHPFRAARRARHVFGRSDSGLGTLRIFCRVAVMS